MAGMPSFSVPASTTNLGHGFDCLGMALELRNTIAVAPRIGDAPPADPALAAMAERVRAAAAAAWGRPLPPLAVAVAGAVPPARGMGSSATIIVGVACACRALAGLPPDAEAVVAVAAEVEGHPDNVAAATLGGLTVAGGARGGMRLARFAVPAGLRAVLAIPAYEVVTAAARAILPPQLSRAEAVRALQRTALIAAALAQGRLAALDGLFEDAWHEQHRAGLNPLLAPVRAAAGAAGALGTFLSGSGSTVLSLVEAGRADAVASALSAMPAVREQAAAVRIVAFAEQGARELTE
jgi:homoserine kinase